VGDRKWLDRDAFAAGASTSQGGMHRLTFAARARRIDDNWRCFPVVTGPKKAGGSALVCATLTIGGLSLTTQGHAHARVIDFRAGCSLK
jgi:hypothetical protein